jgi:hypothetical protein
VEDQIKALDYEKEHIKLEKSIKAEIKSKDKTENPVSDIMTKGRLDLKLMEKLKPNLDDMCGVKIEEFESMLKYYKDKIYTFTFGGAMPNQSDIQSMELFDESFSLNTQQIGEKLLIRATRSNE